MKNERFVATWSGNYSIFKEFPSRVEALECANALNKELGEAVSHPYVVMMASERAKKEAEQTAQEREFYDSLSKEECIRCGIG